MSTEPTPIDTLKKLDQPTSAEPVQQTEKDPTPAPVVPPTAPAPVQKQNLVAVVVFTKKEAAAVLTGLLNGFLTEENFEPRISFPVDRIQLGLPKS